MGKAESGYAASRDCFMAAKEGFDAAYRQADPVSYYRAYAPTRLSIVEYAAALVRITREAGLAAGPVVDLGCGYGTLGALLRTGHDLEGVYTVYTSGRILQCSPNESYAPSIVGVDRSRAALAAAQRARLIDRGVEWDLTGSCAMSEDFGVDPIVVCCAVLGYVSPEALRAAIEQIRPRVAIITCVTWIGAEFRNVFRGSAHSVTQLNAVPVFQRWATAREQREMPTALIRGAHRADCYLVSLGDVPGELLAEQVERTRARRATSRWLAAGKPGGSCELVSTTVAASPATRPEVQ